MTAAALEALELQRCLREDTDRLAQRFFVAAAAVVDIPWSIAVGGDLDLPQTEGRRTLQTRLTNVYLRQVIRAGSAMPSWQQPSCAWPTSLRVPRRC